MGIGFLGHLTARADAGIRVADLVLGIRYDKTGIADHARVPRGVFVFCNVFPFAFLVLLFWTAGLFAYLYVLNAVLLYLLAATPALLCIGRKPYGWILAACAAVLVPIVAFVPAMRSERLSFRHAERLLADDIDTSLAEMPKSIELVGEARRYLGRRTPLNDAPCEALCQRLLLSRQVDLVRVKPDDATRAVNGMDYVLETRPKLCPDAFEEGVALLRRPKTPSFREPALSRGSRDRSRSPHASKSGRRASPRLKIFLQTCGTPATS